MRHTLTILIQNSIDISWRQNDIIVASMITHSSLTILIKQKQKLHKHHHGSIAHQQIRNNRNNAEIQMKYLRLNCSANAQKQQCSDTPCKMWLTACLWKQIFHWPLHLCTVTQPCLPDIYKDEMVRHTCRTIKLEMAMAHLHWWLMPKIMQVGIQHVRSSYVVCWSEKNANRPTVGRMWQMTHKGLLRDVMTAGN